MMEFKENGRVIDIVLDNGKTVKVMTDYIKRNMEALDIDMEEAVMTWLEDEGYLENEEQEELCDLAKENKSHKVVAAKAEKAPKKTAKERTRKENPVKEMVIAEIAKVLPNFATDVVVENAGKLITFKIGDEEFKLDLVQKRKAKKGDN